MSDLKKIVQRQNDGKIARIYSTGMREQFADEFRSLKQVAALEAIVRANRPIGSVALVLGKIQPISRTNHARMRFPWLPRRLISRSTTAT
ncbi:hypothetical protein P7D22_11610 [Lichenihabitans sp. Uapishka_5]|uniref:hypothetical protein n=1 Tax=Lichenihabitans sp. Uapishka_5 TaxID=3037302 RepID=UPI0029E7D3B1|nr:hypothetical protein [Lichenihabitans sp. Uapishka_5]MDX7951816.1 hypothetical protein [Lichenihabitans sp. Uapishka_5]